MTIKQIAIERGLTLKDLAKELGYSRQHLTSVANGRPAGTKLARKLVIWSDGRLKTDDLLYPESA